MDQEQKVKDLFSSMVKDITEQYSAEIKTIVITRGMRPSFDELRDKLIQMEKALTERAVKIIEIYKKETHKNPEPLINDFRDIINKAVENFIKTL